MYVADECAEIFVRRNELGAEPRLKERTAESMAIVVSSGVERFQVAQCSRDVSFLAIHDEVKVIPHKAERVDRYAVAMTNDPQPVEKRLVVQAIDEQGPSTRAAAVDVVNAVLGIETVEAAHSLPLHCFAGKLKATLPNTSVSVNMTVPGTVMFRHCHLCVTAMPWRSERCTTAREFG